MRNFLILFISALFLLSSCASIPKRNYNKEVRQLHLGMSKKEALRIMGNKYNVAGMQKTPDGQFESLYFESLENLSYILVFLDNELVELNSIPVNNPAQPINQPVN